MLPDKSHQLKTLLSRLKNHPDDKFVTTLQDSLLQALSVQNKKTAYVQTAVAMTSAESTQLGKLIQSKFPQVVDINYLVDPAILGGIKIQVGDYVVDDSLQGALKSMHKTLI